MTDTTGAKVWENATRPFGEDATITGSASLNLRFPGQYADDETGLNYNWNRYYDAGIGRYMTPDPIGLRGGVNLFSYTKSNPVNYLDSRGLLYAGPSPPPDANTPVCDGNRGLRIQTGSVTPCIEGCVRVHESVHIVDALRINPNICQGQSNGAGLYWNKKTELRPTEYKGYSAEITCLMASLNKNCDECKQEIEERIEILGAIRDFYSP